jgi:hypothetical protein
MKRFIFLLLLSLAFPLHAMAQEAFTIEDFYTDLTLQPDSSMQVFESIAVNFTAQRHGIFRDIPTKDFKISKVSVTRADGSPWNFKTSSISGGKRIQIGDANVLITGPQTYNIKYHASNGVLFLEDHDEVYWNTTGSLWPTTIAQAAATVHLPPQLSGQNLTFRCFTGAYGSTAEDCTYSQNGDSITFAARSSLGIEEGLTIVIGFPKGLLQPPPKTFLELLAESKVVRGLWALLMLMIFAEPVYRYIKSGRDPKGRTTIIAEYEAPEGMTPAEVGTLIDERADVKDLMASIVDLAVRGYIQIKVLPKALGLLFKEDDYELIKTDTPKKGDKGLNNFEEQLMADLFGAGSAVTISGLKNKFYTHLGPLYKKLYTTMVGKEFFPQDPTTVRLVYFLKGMGLMIFGGFLMSWEIAFWGTAYAAGVLGAGILTLILSFFMPRKTLKGVLVKEKILGFKLYLETAEKDRLKFQETENTFYTFLPFAMVLGVVDNWTAAFAPILKTPPSFYVGSSGSFRADSFVSDLSHISGRLESNLKSQPSSRGGGGGMGGGFSGGGFGGGGGGSW